ncbi:hypothetical protein JCM5296_007586 [Sporobolomyces johnsonii]
MSPHLRNKNDPVLKVFGQDLSDQFFAGAREARRVKMVNAAQEREKRQKVEAELNAEKAYVARLQAALRAAGQLVPGEQEARDGGSSSPASSD